MRRWMVVGVSQVSPEAKLASLVTQGRWQDALDLALQHQISPDDVYK